MLNPVIFYGERGLVNGLVIELTDNINLTKKFLKSIRFCGANTPPWIDKVQQVTFLVEPSFSDFGNPDLVIICDCDGEKHIIFLEAKVVTYIDSAIKLDKKGKKGIPGINSRINTQLTLKYRLSIALEQRKDPSAPVEEPKKNWRAYREYPTETSKKPRRLIKNIGLINEYFSGVTNYWFVALTTDNSKRNPYAEEDFRPVILNTNGQIIWDSVREHFGLITYDQIDNILKQDGFYALARKYFLPKPSPNAIKLRTENWDTFGSFIRNDLRNQLQQIVEDAIDNISGDGFTKKIIKIHNGSDSYVLSQRTLIKLVPKHNGNEERLLLAVLAGTAKAAGIAEQFSNDFVKIGIGNKEREFLCRGFTTCLSDDEKSYLFWVITEFWKEAIEQ